MRFCIYVSKENELDTIFETIGFSKSINRKKCTYGVKEISILLSARILCFILFQWAWPICMGFKTRDAAKAFKKAVELNQCNLILGQWSLTFLQLRWHANLLGWPWHLWKWLCDDAQRHPEGAGLNEIDHLTSTKAVWSTGQISTRRFSRNSLLRH